MMSYKLVQSCILMIAIMVLATPLSFSQEQTDRNRSRSSAKRCKEQPRVCESDLGPRAERASNERTSDEIVIDTPESDTAIVDHPLADTTSAGAATQERRRIIDRRQIQKSSPPARILLAPFRFLAPHVRSGVTRFENGGGTNQLGLFLSNPFIHPTFGGLGDGSGFGAGIYVSTADRLSENYKLFFSTHATLNSYLETIFGVEASPRHVAGGRLKLDLVGRYRVRPEEDFWGVGTNSSRDDRTTYSLNERGAQARATLRIARQLRIGTLVDYSSNTVTAGQDKRFATTAERFGSAGLPGLESGAALLGAGVFAEYDARDVAENPHSGLYTRFAVTANDSVGQDDFGFLNYSLDARGYLPLGTKRRVLAVRVRGDFNEPKGGSQIPFFRLAHLGDGETLRGYDTYRFHGRHALHANVEYRYQLAAGFDKTGLSGIEAVAFTDMGQVFNRRAELSIDNLRATWGGGLQFSSGRSTLFRFLYARSPEGSRVFFSFGPTF